MDSTSDDRQSYVPPELTMLGTVEEMTAGSGGSKGDSGMKTMKPPGQG